MFNMDPDIIYSSVNVETFMSMLLLDIEQASYQERYRDISRAMNATVND